MQRGPRYFDPPEEQGETCHNCGQVGHKVAACTEQPRQKPCYVCGNFGHDGYDCSEVWLTYLTCSPINICIGRTSVMVIMVW